MKFFSGGEWLLGLVMGGLLLGLLILISRLLTLTQSLEQEVTGHSEERAQLVSLMTHEITNGMNIIQSSLKLLERHYQVRSSPQGKRYYDRAMRAFDGITNVIDSVRFSPVGHSASILVKPEALEFDEAAEFVRFLFTDRMDFKGVHLEVINKLARGTLLWVDATSFIHTILAHLISNAIKYSHPGGTVKLVCEDWDDRLVKMTVSDEGIGMTIEDQQNIFNMPYRESLAGTAGEPPGAGCGLPVVYTLIKNAGGSIKLDSLEGRGTTVTALLPKVTNSISQIA